MRRRWLGSLQNAKSGTSLLQSATTENLRWLKKPSQGLVFFYFLWLGAWNSELNRRHAPWHLPATLFHPYSRSGGSYGSNG
jgi:hypothetical protein